MIPLKKLSFIYIIQFKDYVISHNLLQENAQNV